MALVHGRVVTIHGHHGRGSGGDDVGSFLRHTSQHHHRDETDACGKETCSGRAEGTDGYRTDNGMEVNAWRVEMQAHR